MARSRSVGIGDGERMRRRHVPLRPAIAAAAVAVTAVSLLGGVLFYRKASDALASALDTAESDAYSQLSQSVAHGKANVESGKVQARASLGHATAQGETNMEQVMAQAHRSLVASVDDGSDADIRLFASELRLTFQAAEEQVVKIQESVLQLAPTYATMEDFSDRTIRDMCGMLLGFQQKGQFRVTGAGATLWHGDRDKQLHPAHGRFGVGFCWWDYPGGHHVFTNEPGAGVHWYVQKDVEWRDDTYVYDSDEGGTVAGEPDFVSPMSPIEFDSSGLMSIVGEEVGTELVSVHWDVANAYYGTKNWSTPQTWWIAPENYYYDESLREEGVALYLTYQQTTKMPGVGPFAGMLVQSEAEVDLGVWKIVIHDFIRTRKPKGVFMVVNDLYELCFAHSIEPAPDMASTEACSNGESAGLSKADSSACFPQVWNYSTTSQFIFRELRNQPQNTLVTGTHRDAAHYLRKCHLQTLGEGFDLDVMWAMPSADVQGELDTQRAQAEAALGALIAEQTDEERAFARRAEAGFASVEAAMRANTSERISRLRMETQDDVNAALVLMAAFCAVSFAVNCAVSAGWVALLANPLREVAKCVVLMGQMHIDEAIQRDLAAGPSRVAEVHRLRSGFSTAARLLAEFRTYLPQSVLRDCSDGDDDTEADKGMASPHSSAFSSPRFSGPHSPSGRSGSSRGSSRGTKATKASRQQRQSRRGSGAPAAALRIEPASKRVSLVACNHRGFLPALAQEAPRRVSQWLGEEVAHCAWHVAAQKGVVGLISADRVYASFGAVRLVCAHRQAAARAAAGAARRDEFGDVEIRRITRGAYGALACLPVSTAACSGPALCGDFGSAAQQQFMSLGGVSSLLLVLERLASQWEAATVVDVAVHAEAAEQWCCRLRGHVVYPKRGDDRQLCVWEVLVGEERVSSGGELDSDMSVSQSQEWMYHLPGSCGQDRWQPYNDAMHLWIDGSVEEAERAAGAAEAEVAAGDVHQALQVLRERIAASAGAAPRSLLVDGGMAESWDACIGEGARASTAAGPVTSISRGDSFPPSVPTSSATPKDSVAQQQLGIIDQFYAAERKLKKARHGERAQQLQQIDGKVRERRTKKRVSDGHAATGRSSIAVVALQEMSKIDRLQDRDRKEQGHGQHHVMDDVMASLVDVDGSRAVQEGRTYDPLHVEDSGDVQPQGGTVPKATAAAGVMKQDPNNNPAFPAPECNAVTPTTCSDIIDAFAQLATDKHDEQPKRTGTQQQRDTQANNAVLADNILRAMDYSQLAVLVIKYKLPGDCLLDAASAREGLRRYRDGREKTGDSDALTSI